MEIILIIRNFHFIFFNSHLHLLWEEMAVTANDDDTDDELDVLTLLPTSPPRTALRSPTHDDSSSSSGGCCGASSRSVRCFAALATVGFAINLLLLGALGTNVLHAKEASTDHAAEYAKAFPAIHIAHPHAGFETDPAVAAALNAMYADSFMPHNGQCHAPLGPATKAALRRRRSKAPELQWQRAAQEIGRTLDERQFGEHQRCDPTKMQEAIFNVWGFTAMLVDHMDEELIGPWMSANKLILYSGPTPYHSVNSEGVTGPGVASLTWAKGDSTLPCDTFYGCYWEHLSKCDALFPKTAAQQAIDESPPPRELGGKYDALTAQLRTFHHRHGPLLLRIAIQAYLWRPVEALSARIDAAVELIFSASSSGDLKVDAAGAGNCVAVHIRRGDECHDKNKVCPPVSTFIDVARQFAKRYELTSLFLATDDESVIKEVIAAAPELTVVWNKAVNRSGYAVSKAQDADPTAASGKPNFFVEERVARGELSPTPILDVLVDIEAASRCSAFVGDGQSHVGDMVLLKMAWYLGYVPPFYATRGNFGLPWGAMQQADGSRNDFIDFWTTKSMKVAPLPLGDCGDPAALTNTTTHVTTASFEVRDTWSPTPAPRSKSEEKMLREWLSEEVREDESQARVVQKRSAMAPQPPSPPPPSTHAMTGGHIAQRFCASLPTPSSFEKTRRFNPDPSIPVDRNELRRAAGRANELRMHIEAQSATCAAGKKRFVTPQYGVGAKLTAMLKPWTAAFGGSDTLSHFATPFAPEGGDISRWGLMPLHPHEGKGCGADAVNPSAHGPPLMDGMTQEEDMLELVPAEYRSEGLFWWVAQSWSWLLRPDPDLRAEIDTLKASLQWERYRPILAIHLRGGDSCLDGSNKGNGGAWRKCSPLSEYLAEAKYLMKRYTFNAIFLATDVDSVIAEARAITASNELGIPILTPPLRASTANLRGAANVISGVTSVNGTKLLSSATLRNIDRRYEDTVMMGLVDPTLDTREVLRDIHLLAEADAFIGKYSSNVDRIAIALSYGKKQCAIPYVSFDSPWCTNFGWGIGRNLENGKSFLC